MDYLKDLNPINLYVDIYNKMQTEDKEHYMRQGTTEIIVLPTSVLILSFLISVLAAYLAFERNKHESTGVRILYTLIAYWVSAIYLIYYLLTQNKNKTKK